jgi:hypothetical protein
MKFFNNDSTCSMPLDATSSSLSVVSSKLASNTTKRNSNNTDTTTTLLHLINSLSVEGKRDLQAHALHKLREVGGGGAAAMKEAYQEHFLE